MENSVIEKPISTESVNRLFQEHLELLEATRVLDEKIVAASELMAEAFKGSKKVLLCGNGGSAGDSQHIAGEFVGRFLQERQALPALALNTNSSIVTAIGNDYGYDRVFSRQVEALGVSGDVLVGISTSGNSGNVVEAFKVAKEKGLKIIGLTGTSGGKMMDLCNVCINVPSPHTPRIQEMHILIAHMICEMVELEVMEK